MAKARSWSRTALGALVLLIASIAGCGTMGPEGTGSSSEALDTIICGMIPVAGAGGLSEEPEFYIVRSMNRKLGYYPEFASAIGMNSVATCDEARLFSRRYATYFAAHPYFDQDLPSNPGALELPKIPAAAQQATSSVEKIFNGAVQNQPADSFPVVQITYSWPAGTPFFNGTLINNGAAGSVSCGGVFISPNWILTAAHCLATRALQYDPTQTAAQRAQWVTALNVDIERANGRIDRDTYVQSIVHPSYTQVVHPETHPTGLGLPAPTVVEHYDLALLYLPPTLDEYLLPGDGVPSSGAQSSWDVQSAQAGQLVSSWLLTAYGWGPTDGFNAHVGVLNAFTESGAELSNAGLFDPGTSANTEFESQVTLANWPNWALCEGDSGSPLVREVRDGSNNLITTVVVAVASNFEAQAGQLCGSQVMDKSAWARTDAGKNFFIDAMKHWQLTPQFDVDSHTIDEPSKAKSYLQLHGSSCSRDCECLTSEFCYNPITDPNARKGCLACSDCSCLRGQCLPSPDWRGPGVGQSRMCLSP